MGRGLFLLPHKGEIHSDGIKSYVGNPLSFHVVHISQVERISKLMSETGFLTFSVKFRPSLLMSFVLNYGENLRMPIVVYIGPSIVSNYKLLLLG